MLGDAGVRRRSRAFAQLWHHMVSRSVSHLGETVQAEAEVTRKEGNPMRVFTRFPRRPAVALMSILALASFGIAGAQSATADSNIPIPEPTPGCDYSVANQVSCTAFGETVVIQSSESGLTFNYSGYPVRPGPVLNSEVIAVDGDTNGFVLPKDLRWTASTYQFFVGLTSDEYSGDTTISPPNGGQEVIVNFNLPVGAQGNPNPVAPNGYLEVSSSGTVYPYGNAQDFGSVTTPLNGSIVGGTVSPGAKGYWLLGSDGGIFTFGAAQFSGSTGAMRLNQPILGMAATGDGDGYWLVASDGGIFSFGDAQFYGSMGATPLNQPVVGMTTTPDGRGYRLVASDGGIFSFGDAQFYGSTGNIHLNSPIVGMAPTPDNNGYWMVAADGGIFAFGDAGFYGSTGGQQISAPIRAMAATPDGGGYWLFGTDGNVYAFGDATNYGSALGIQLGTAFAWPANPAG
jgi:hypothetical protein